MAPFAESQVKQNDTRLNDLPKFLWKTSRMPKCRFHQTAPVAANQSQLVHHPLLHFPLELNCLDTCYTRLKRAPKYTSRREELLFSPGEGEQSHWHVWLPSSVRCSIQLCLGLGTHHGDHLAPFPAQSGGSRKVKVTSKPQHSQWHQLIMVDEHKIQL